MTKRDKLKAHLQRYGFFRTAFWLLMRGASSFLGFNLFVVRTSLTPKTLDNPCRLANLDYRRLDTDEALRWTEDTELELDPEISRSALERGDILFGAFDGSRLISYIWRSVSCAPHSDEVWVRVARPYCYSYKSFARPDYRGQRIVPALILYSDQEMLKDGYTHRAGYVDVSNFASLAMAGPMGSEHIGHAGFLHWFGRCFSFRTKPVRDIGFEFFGRRSD